MVPRKYRSIFGVLLATLLVLAAVAANAMHNDGLAADYAGFGVGGIVTAAPLEIHAVALQPDGKIVAVGVQQHWLAVARFLSYGVPDPSFGTQGLVTLPMTTTPQRSVAHDLVLQPDGKIVVVGTVIGVRDNDLVVARFHTDGRLDRSFAANGIALIDVAEGDDSGTAVAFDPSDRIVVGGSAQIGGRSQFLAASLTINGQLDRRFGDAGLALVDFGRHAFAYDLLIQPEGEVLLAGRADPEQAGFGTQVALARLTAAGIPDTRFDRDGKTTNGTTDDDSGKRVALQAEKIVVSGSGAGTAFLTLRFHADGSLDQEFADGGKLITAFPSVDTQVFASLVLPEGQLLVAGQSAAQMVVVRYTRDGKPDPTFGTDGIVMIDPLPNVTEPAYDLVRSPDGRLLVAGDRFLARLFADGSLDAGGRQLAAPYDSVRQALPLNSGALQALLQLDGKLVSIGQAQFGNFDRDLALASYTLSGHPDLDFGRAGTTVLARPDHDEGLADAALLNDLIFVIGTQQAHPEAKKQLLLTGIERNGAPLDVCPNPLESVPNSQVEGLQITSHLLDGLVGVARLTVSSEQAPQTVLFRVSLTEDGCKLDENFGKGGWRSLQGQNVVELLRLSQGKLLVVSSENDYVLLERFLANGVRDRDFGVDGQRLVFLGKDSFVSAAALTRDQKIVVAGWQRHPRVNGMALLMRLTTAGEPDRGFGVEGTTLTEFDTQIAELGLAVRYDGAIALAGCDPFGTAPLALFTPTGLPDTSFGTDGQTELNIGGGTCLRSAIFHNSWLFVVGYARTDAGFTFAHAAYPTTRPRQMSFSTPSMRISEAEEAAILTVTMNQTSALSLTVAYAATGGSANNGTDYTLADGTLTFAPGQTSQRIRVPLINDLLDEPDETVVVQLGELRMQLETGFTALPSTISHTTTFTITLVDDDHEPGRNRALLPLVVSR
jgi:uncharacterized delta-60 repeat protein